MESFYDHVAGLDPGLAILLILAGLVYGLFGWRLVHLLTVLDAAVIALVIGLGVCSTDGGGLALSRLSIAIPILVALPYLAWRFPDKAVLGCFGVIGFLATQLFLLEVELPVASRILVGALGGGILMSLGTTMRSQMAVVVTSIHAAWFFVAAIAVVASQPQGVAGQVLGVLRPDLPQVVPLAALVFSLILIFHQWADLEKSSMPH